MLACVLLWPMKLAQNDIYVEFLSVCVKRLQYEEMIELVRIQARLLVVICYVLAYSFVQKTFREYSSCATAHLLHVTTCESSFASGYDLRT